MPLLLSISIALFATLFLIGLIISCRNWIRRKSRPPYLNNGRSSDDSNDGGGGGGWDYDPEAPLDLPPGVYVMPEEPVGVGV